MYALSFDMNIADLKEYYGEIYNMRIMRFARF